jgi:hypothetical protein
MQYDIARNHNNMNNNNNNFSYPNPQIVYVGGMAGPYNSMTSSGPSGPWGPSGPSQQPQMQQPQMQQLNMQQPQMQQLNMQQLNMQPLNMQQQQPMQHQHMQQQNPMQQQPTPQLMFQQMQQQMMQSYWQPYWTPMMMGSAPIAVSAPVAEAAPVPAPAPLPVVVPYRFKKRNAAQMEEKVTLGGKWTVEEEAYAAVLIQHFRTGALQDCEECTTLRSYLAEKLECIPMRISKKFAGTKIRKEIFRRGASSSEVAMQLDYIRDLFVQSTSKKRKRVKRKMQKAALEAKEAAEEKEAAGDKEGDDKEELAEDNEEGGEDNEDTDVETSPPFIDVSAVKIAAPLNLGDKACEDSGISSVCSSELDDSSNTKLLTL